MRSRKPPQSVGVDRPFKPPRRIKPFLGVMLRPNDLALLQAIQDKLGVENTSDLIRQALRLLAAKEGVAA